MKTFPLKEYSDILRITDLMELDESNEISYYSFNEKDIWFVLLVKFYENKEILPELCNTFNIPYPENMLNITLPFQYCEETLNELFKNKLIKGYEDKVKNRYYDITGKWFNRLKRNGFDEKETIKKTKKYEELPWDLLIKNPLLKEDFYFEQIIKNIEENKLNYHHIAFVSLHLELSKEQYSELLKSIPFNYHYQEIFYNAIEKGIEIAMKKFSSKESCKYTVKEKLPFLTPEYQLKAILNFKEDGKKLWLLKHGDVDPDVKLKVMEELI